MTQHVEVCPVPREVMLPGKAQPLCRPLQSTQSTLRFFHDPLPAVSTGSLALPLPVDKTDRQDDRFTAFRRDDTRREGTSSRPPIFMSLCPQYSGEQPIGSRFGSGLSASFDLFCVTVLQPEVHMCLPFVSAWPPVRLDAGRSGSRLTGRSAPEGEGTLSLPLQTRPLPVTPGQVGYPSGKTGFSS